MRRCAPHRLKPYEQGPFGTEVPKGPRATGPSQCLIVNSLAVVRRTPSSRWRRTQPRHVHKMSNFGLWNAVPAGPDQRSSIISHSAHLLCKYANITAGQRRPTRRLRPKFDKTLHPYLNPLKLTARMRAITERPRRRTSSQLSLRQLYRIRDHDITWNNM